MKNILLLILLSVKMFSQPGPKITFKKFDRDAAHVYAGIIICGASGSWIYKKTKSPFLSCVGGALIGGGAGVFKELVMDKSLKMGVCSNNDMVLTGWGSLVGSFVLRIAIDVKQKRDFEKEQFQNLADSLNLNK